MKITRSNNFLDNTKGAKIVCLTLARNLKTKVYTTSIDLEKVNKRLK